MGDENGKDRYGGGAGEGPAGTPDIEDWSYFHRHVRTVEELLRESERRFSELTDSLPQVVFEINTEGELLYTNKYAFTAFGYAREDLERGFNIMQALVPEDRERASADMRDAINGIVKPNTEYRCLRKDGSTFPVIIYPTPVILGGKPVGLRGIIIDITDRKEAEETLRRTEEKYRSIVENAVEGIFQSTPEGRFISVNPAMARLAGYSSPEEMISSISDIAREYYVHPEERRVYKGRLDESGVVENFEHQIYRKDRTIIWVSASSRAVKDASGRVLYYEGTVLDITERKLMLEELLESEERYRLAIEGSNDGVALLKSGILFYVSRRFVEIFGYAGPEEVKGRPLSALIHPDDAALVEQAEGARQEGGGMPVRCEARGLRKDGSVVHLEVAKAGTIYRGRPATLVYITDVTDRKMADIEKVRLESQLLHAQKMEAVGQLAGGVAHDFNNILTTIIGYANLLQMKAGKTDPVNTYVEQILKSAHRAAQLTHSLLAFSRKQTIELRPQSIDSIVRSVEKLLRRLLTEDIELKVNLSAGDQTVLADAAQIDQVLMNLTANAKDAMPRGGTLSIETRAVEIDAAFVKAHGYGTPGSYTLITVSDTGCGMDGQTLERVFEPFFTTKEVGKGTGLGLSIVYGIIKHHGGYIDVSSEPGKGTSFHIYLPAIKARVDQQANNVEEIRGGTETVLLAEDNPDVRKMIRLALAEKGYRVIEASDGQEALDRFIENRNSIDVAVLDVVMPKRNGKEVYETINAMEPGIRVLFMSGYTADVVLDKGLGNGSFDYVSKPLSLEDLMRRLREIIDRPARREPTA